MPASIAASECSRTIGAGGRFALRSRGFCGRLDLKRGDIVMSLTLFRITLDPSRQNGLNRVSQIMVDEVLTLPREKSGKRVGHLGNALAIRVGRALSVWLGMS